jgi:5'-nucleotidase (lipoprotein e(P4) family)
VKRGLPLILLLLAGCAGGSKVPASAAPLSSPPGLAGMQYLYGSGEAAAISRQAWAALVDYVAGRVGGKDRSGVVLAEGAKLAAPKFVPCASKPPAAVFDVDETVLLNLGFEGDDLARGTHPYDAARWDRWEKTGVDAVLPTPGAKEALDSLRAMGLTVIFNSNRNVRNAEQTERTIDRAGIGPAVHGKSLFLSGDDSSGSHKDARRALIASRYCVVAMGGDQLGDFSDLFNASLNPSARRTATGAAGTARLWGRGWFVLPNSVYGSALKGGAEDIFPADTRWSDPADATRSPDNALDPR